MQASPTSRSRFSRVTPWVAVVLALGMSGYLVWSSNAPQVALLEMFGETASARIVDKQEVHRMGSPPRWDLRIGFESAVGESREFGFEAIHYPRVMETGPFEVAYLSAAPWIVCPAPVLHWNASMLVIGMVPGLLAILLALVAWYERTGHHRPWARRLDAGMESAWQRLSERLHA